MHTNRISKVGDQIHVEGFPNAARLIRLSGKQAKELADLSLHQEDLEFADSCLEAINDLGSNKDVVREALWRSAISHFIKCFGEGVRFRLKQETLFPEPEAALAYDYFLDLRNKHHVHDVNAYSQSVPSAVINKLGMAPKVERVMCIKFLSETLEQENYQNLAILIKRAKEWVSIEFESRSKSLREELEQVSHQELLARNQVEIKVPELKSLKAPRKSP